MSILYLRRLYQRKVAPEPAGLIASHRHAIFAARIAMLFGSMVLPRAPKALFTTLCILAVLFLLVGCGKDSLVNPRIGPTADFTASPQMGDQPLDVTFTDTSIPGSSSITSWFWDFGDGTTSPVRSAAHLYGAPGIYNVSLKVTTDDGTDTEIKADFITVTR